MVEVSPQKKSQPPYKCFLDDQQEHFISLSECKTVDMTLSSSVKDSGLSKSLEKSQTQIGEINMIDQRVIAEGESFIAKAYAFEKLVKIWWKQNKDCFHVDKTAQRASAQVLDLKMQRWNHHCDRLYALYSND